MHADVAVVGGGFAGLSAALHLLGRAPGMRVVVLEAARAGAGASGRTTGMLGPGVGQSLAALVRRFGPARAAALYRATLRAVRDVERLIAVEGIDCDLVMGGQIVWARTASCRRRLARQARLFAALDLPVEVLDDAALLGALCLAPAPGSADDGPAALRLPIAGTLHPGKLVAALADRVRRRGGLLLEGARVARLDAPVARERPVRLELGGGATVVARDVVLATAGYTADLGVMRGRVLPVHLQALATEPLPPAAIARLGWARREGVVDARRVFSYFRLTADNRIVFGGGAPRYHWGGRTGGDAAGEGDGEGDGGDRGAARALAKLEADLRRTFAPVADVTPSAAWTGVIGYVLDALPAIQRLRDRPGILHVGGWSGHGVALSLASGAWVAALVCDGAAPEDLPWFRDRPPLVPGEPIRFAAFHAAVAAMQALDRMA
jgi:gamma-glutamylputrescine oxidase